MAPRGQGLPRRPRARGRTSAPPAGAALGLDEIPRLLNDYRHAARCAHAAGFDGVELHAANGYLIQQFLDATINKRTDAYGGSVENRTRLLGQVIDALLDELDADRIGVRLSPPGGKDLEMVEATWLAATDRLANKRLAYLHVLRPDSFRQRTDDPEPGHTLLAKMKDVFDGLFVANASFDAAEATEWIEQEKADAIAFGRPFISNPDLPIRLATDSPLNEPDNATYYGGGAAGYTDYPTLEATQQPKPVIMPA